MRSSHTLHAANTCPYRPFASVLTAYVTASKIDRKSCVFRRSTKGRKAETGYDVTSCGSDERAAGLPSLLTAWSPDLSRQFWEQKG